MYGKYKKSANAREISEQEKFELVGKHTALTESAERLGTDRGQEEELRSRYRAVRPGEELIVIVDDRASEVNEKEKTSWFSDMVMSIRGLFLEKE